DPYFGFRAGDVFTDGIFIAEKVARKFAVDDHWFVARAVVLLAEPSAADHPQAKHVFEVIGHGVTAEMNKLSCFFVIAAARPIASRIRSAPDARGGFNLAEFAQRGQQSSRSLQLLRLVFVVDAGAALNSDIPDVLVVESERPAVVVRVIDREDDHREHDQEGKEDLESDQKIDPFSGPDQ